MAEPITLTRSQYMQTAAGKRDKDYGAYRRYIAKRRPARQAARNDPFAPLNDQQIRSRASADVRSQIDPLVAEITRSIGARTQAGMGAIGGYTNQLAQNLAPYADKAREIYGQAQASQAASDSALSQMLSGQGGSLASGLAERLGKAGVEQPTIDKMTGQVVQTGQGAAGALYGAGSASMSNLIAQSAAAQEYAAKQPGIAQLGGLQASRDLQLSSQRDLADQTGEIRSKVPGLVQQLLGDYRQNELSKAGAREERRISDRDFAFDQRVFQEGVLGDRGKMQFEAREAAAERKHEAAMARAEFQRDMAKSTVQYQREMAAAEKAWRRSKQDAAAARAYESRQAAAERRHEARQAALERKEKAKDRASYGSGSKSGGGKSSGKTGWEGTP